MNGGISKNIEILKISKTNSFIRGNWQTEIKITPYR